MNDKLLACYGPTTVVLIDDDPDYLVAVRSQLNKDNTAYKIFENPVKALEYFKKEYHPDPFTNRAVLHEDEGQRDVRSIGVNVHAIHEEIYNPKRFDQVSVLVVDQMMPGLKGLDLCRELKDLPVKKIMLTGEASEGDAVKAFNDGIIDRFINKNDKDFANVVNSAIAELQKEYFEQLSGIVINSLTQVQEMLSLSCSTDKAFMKFFQDFIRENHITEYYLADTEGSFLLLDFKGKPSWLVVKDEEAMLATYQLAENADIKLSEKTLQALKENKSILYLHSPGDFLLPPSEWEQEKRLFPAKKIEGSKQNYYYAHIKDVDSYDIQKDKVLSFHDYLEKLV